MQPSVKNAFFGSAWIYILFAYITSGIIGFGFGSFLMGFANLEPETVFDMSTKRLSYALPFIQHGQHFGVDQGVLIFLWNALGAAATISFVYTVSWFDPARKDRHPRIMRKFFCIPKPMRLLCYLPGCRRFEEEPLRRVYVWLMVPLLGMILLGMESGMSLSVGKTVFGSHFIALVALLPHGIIEIPTFSLAGAVAFSAHLMIKRHGGDLTNNQAFEKVERYRNDLPIKKIALAVMVGLLVAGIIEAHITQPLVIRLLH